MDFRSPGREPTTLVCNSRLLLVKVLFQNHCFFVICKPLAMNRKYFRGILLKPSTSLQYTDQEIVIVLVITRLSDAAGSYVFVSKNEQDTKSIIFCSYNAQFKE